MTSLASNLGIVRRPAFWRAASIAVGLAAVLNLLIWAIAGLVLGEAIRIVEPRSTTPAALGVAPVLAASIIPAVLGMVFVGVLVGSGRATLAAAITGVLTLASLALPLGLDVGFGSGLALGLMHLVVGGAVVAVALQTQWNREM